MAVAADFVNIVAVLGTTGTLVGTGLTIYYGMKANRLERERVTLNWNELQIGCQELAKVIKQHNFVPDIVLVLSVRGATIAGIVLPELDINGPLYTCVQGSVDYNFAAPTQSYTCVETGRWRIFIPDSLKEFVDKKILIFDDLVMSGDSLSCVRNQILSFGFDNAKTETAALVCTTMAREARKAPDFSWYETPTNRFYFPWGQAR